MATESVLTAAAQTPEPVGVIACAVVVAFIAWAIWLCVREER